MRSLVNHWWPLTHASHRITTSRPAAATQTRARVSPAIHIKVLLYQMPFLPQPSLFPGSGTRSKYADLHTVRPGYEVKRARRKKSTNQSGRARWHERWSCWESCWWWRGDRVKMASAAHTSQPRPEFWHTFKGMTIYHNGLQRTMTLTLTITLSLTLTHCGRLWPIAVKVKRRTILQKEHRRGAHLLFIGRWARRWINHYCLRHMASATPDLRLPSQPKLVLIVPTHGGMARLSWLGWLVTYRDSLPARRRSPIQVLTGPSVE